MKRVLGLAVLFSLSTAAFAGRFDSYLSDTDARSIHKLGVVVLLGDTLYIDRRGLTAFENKSFKVSVPQWQLDESITKHIVDVMRARGRFVAESLNLAENDFAWSQWENGFDSAGRRMILDRGSKQGVDAVLVLSRESNPHSIARPGFGFSFASVFGKVSAGLVASFGVYLWQVPSDKPLAQQHPDPLLGPKPDAFPMKAASWDAYSEEEQSTLESAIKQDLTVRVDQILDSMKLTTRPEG